MVNSSSPKVPRSRAEAAASHRSRYKWFALGTVAIVFLIALRFAGPAAPETVSIVTRPAGTSDHDFAVLYRDALEAKGLSVSLIDAQVNTDNLEQILAVDGAGLAFVMSGLERELDDPTRAGSLFSLGSIALDPLWIFVNVDSDIESIGDLEGRAVLLGPAGSKSRVLAEVLLGDHDIEVAEVQFESVADIEEALRNGEAEVGFFVGDPDSEGIGKLLASPALRPMTLELAEAYVSRSQWLRAVTYPRGAFDPGRTIPAVDLSLIAGSANLVIHRETHPALTDLLLDIASREHSGAGAFWPRGTFPSPDGVSLELDPAADRFYTEGPPRWRRLLPYRLATFIDRMTVVVIPVLTAFLVVFQLIPGLLKLRLGLRLAQFYRRLEALEKAAGTGTSGAELSAELDSLDRDSVDLWVPRPQVSAYMDFRQFLHDMRDRLPTDSKD